MDLSDASIAASNKANDQPYHTIAKGNTEYNPTIVSLYTEKDKLTDYIFGRVKGLKTLITPKSVTSMTAKSIDNRLTECTINSKVLPKGLFKREKDDDLTATNSMEKMEFSNNLEVIGDSVAVNYDKMQGLDKMVRMPDNVWYIGDCSFKDYFHAPKYMSVNALKTDDVAIKAEGLTIEVEGLDDGKQLQVYDIDGRLVYAGAGRRITLPGAGLYIVKAGIKIQKITVQ